MNSRGRKESASRGAGRPANETGPLVLRRDLVRLAAWSIASDGYGPTSLRDLARRLGVSLATVQHRVKSKEQLLYAIVDGIVIPQLAADRRRLERIVEEIQTSAEPQYLPRELVRATMLIRGRSLMPAAGVVAAVVRDRSDGCERRRRFVIEAIRPEREASLAALGALAELGLVRPVSPELWTVLDFLIVPALQHDPEVLAAFGFCSPRTYGMVPDVAELLTDGLVPRTRR